MEMAKSRLLSSAAILFTVGLGMGVAQAGQVSESQSFQVRCGSAVTQVSDAAKSRLQNKALNNEVELAFTKKGSKLEGSQQLQQFQLNNSFTKKGTKAGSIVGPSDLSNSFTKKALKFEDDLLRENQQLNNAKPALTK